MKHGGIQRVLASIAAVVLTTFLAVVAAPSAWAHVDVNTYTPGTGEIVQTTPDEISLQMSSEVGNVKVKLFHRDGREVPLTGDGAVTEGKVITVRPPALDIGTYVVTWESLGPDGHLAAGQSYFSVGTEDGLPGDFTSDVDQSVPLPVKLSQWASYAALAAAFGAAWLAITGLVGSARRRRVIAYASAGLLMAAELARLLLVSGQLAESLPEGLSVVLGARPSGFGWLLIAAGAALLALARPWFAVAGVLLAGTGEILTGHLAFTPQWMVLVPLAAVHLFAVCVWIGPLVAQVVAGHRGRAAGFRFAASFTWWAASALAVVAISGVTMASLRMGTLSVDALFSREYGTTLLTKIAILLALVAPLGGYHAGRVLLAKAREYQSKLDRSDPPQDAASETSVPSHAGASDTATDGPADSAGGGRLRGISSVTLALEAVILLAIVALGASLSGMPPTASASPALSAAGGGQDLLAAPKSFDECLSKDEGSDQLLCIERYLTDVAQTQGMPLAIKEITTRWLRGDEWMQKNCHSIGHKIGRLGYRMFGDIQTAFKQGSDPCDYGYLHGVIEGASADFSDEQLQDSMSTMCEPVGDLSNHTYRQCIHGLGHAAARRVNNDLPRAMAFCDAYYKEGIDVLTEAEPEALRFNLCVSGVSMEWNTQPKALDSMRLPIGAPGTLMDGCVKLPERFHTACIEYATSAMGGKYDREIAAREWCDKNLKEPLPCYQSIGRDVIWSPTITDEQAMEVCTGGKQGKYVEACLTRALGSVATIALDASAIDEYCPVLPEQYRHLCPLVRDAMKVQIEQTLRGYILEEDAPAGTSAEAVS